VKSTAKLQAIKRAASEDIEATTPSMDKEKNANPAQYTQSGECQKTKGI